MRVIFAKDNLLLILSNFAHARLTAKQKAILHLLRILPLSDKPITRIVGIFSQEMKCSLSAIWLNLAQLKAIGFVNSLILLGLFYQLQ